MSTGTLWENVAHRKSRIRELKNRVLRAIRPVFQELQNGEPDPIATCVLVQVQGKRFILSAAHVFDFFGTAGPRLNKLYIENQGRYLDITAGELYRTGRPGDDHDDDPIDAGILALPDNTSPELRLEDCLQLGDLEINPTENNARLYIGFGFPVVNTRRTFGENHLNMDGISCTGPSMSDTVEPLGFDHTMHIVVEYDRYDMWVGEEWAEAPEPTGMSGGGLFRFDSLLNPTAGPGSADDLAGILIEKRTEAGVIIATRIRVFIDMIRRTYPDLFH